MRTIKLEVAYDGSCYHGFQKQRDYDTIQSILEEKLAMLCGERVVIAGSGRTDAGVHALAQTVTFTTNGRIPCPNIVRASRRLLPRDIVIVNAQEVEEGFHARFSACWKAYQYRVLSAEHPNPFLMRYAWQMPAQLDAAAMNDAAALLLGTHDFSAFRSSGSVDSPPIKTIYEAHWTELPEHEIGAAASAPEAGRGSSLTLQGLQRELVFRIAGDGFLYHMVRNIVWSLVQVGLGKRSKADFAAELCAQRCEFLNEPAPAEGLYLAEVCYRPYPER